MTASTSPVRTFTRTPRFSYDERHAYFFLAPLAAVLMGVAVFPVIYSFYISLYSLRLTRPNRVPFVWFDNYVTVLSDPQFWAAGERTVTFSVMAATAAPAARLVIAAPSQRDVSPDPTPCAP